MPADWPEIRDLAKELIDADDCSEVAARCSIGRAYYAAFHAIEPLCRCVPGDPPDHGTAGLGHKQIAQRLRDFRRLNPNTGLASLILEARNVAVTYQQALTTRRLADYDLTETIDKTYAEMQLLRVKELLQFAVRARTAFDRLGLSRSVSEAAQPE